MGSVQSLHFQHEKGSCADKKPYRNTEKTQEPSTSATPSQTASNNNFTRSYALDRYLKVFEYHEGTSLGHCHLNLKIVKQYRIRDVISDIKTVERKLPTC